MDALADLGLAVLAGGLTAWGLLADPRPAWARGRGAWRFAIEAGFINENGDWLGP